MGSWGEPLPWDVSGSRWEGTGAWGRGYELLGTARLAQGSLTGSPPGLHGWASACHSAGSDVGPSSPTAGSSSAGNSPAVGCMQRNAFCRPGSGARILSLPRAAPHLRLPGSVRQASPCGGRRAPETRGATPSTSVETPGSQLGMRSGTVLPQPALGGGGWRGDRPPGSKYAHRHRPSIDLSAPF